MFADASPSPLAWSGDTITTLASDTESGSLTEVGDMGGLRLEADEHLAYNGATLGQRQHTSDNLRAEDLFDYFGDALSDAESGAVDLTWSIRPEQVGTRALVFVPGSQGSYQIRLSLRPMWDPTTTPLADYQIGVRARPRARIDGRGLVQPTKEAWVRQKAATR
jgi:hypothetical protein